MWVADRTDNTVTRIDPESSSVVSTTPVGRGPTAIALGSGSAWVANTQDDTLSRIDAETGAVTATIEVGARPTGLAFDDDTGSLWIANSLDGSVSQIAASSGQVTRTVEVGESLRSIEVEEGLVWVTVQAAPQAAETDPSSGSDALTVLQTRDPGPTDPALFFGGDYARAYATCGLLENYPDEPAPKGSQLQPELATGPPEVSADGLTYIYTVRSDLSFSPPSQEPVTATAFRRAIERALDPVMHSYAATFMTDIEGADAFAAGENDHVSGVVVDGRRLSITLTQPAPDLPARLATPWLCAVPPATPVTSKGVEEIPTAGPYYVADSDPGQSVVLRRNPNYGGPRAAELEEIQFRFGDDPDDQPTRYSPATRTSIRTPSSAAAFRSIAWRSWRPSSAPAAPRPTPITSSFSSLPSWPPTPCCSTRSPRRSTTRACAGPSTSRSTGGHWHRSPTRTRPESPPTSTSRRAWRGTRYGDLPTRRPRPGTGPSARGRDRRTSHALHLQPAGLRATRSDHQGEPRCDWTPRRYPAIRIRHSLQPDRASRRAVRPRRLWVLRRLRRPLRFHQRLLRPRGLEHQLVR